MKEIGHGSQVDRKRTALTLRARSRLKYPQVGVHEHLWENVKGCIPQLSFVEIRMPQKPSKHFQEIIMKIGWTQHFDKNHTRKMGSRKNPTLKMEFEAGCGTRHQMVFRMSGAAFSLQTSEKHGEFIWLDPKSLVKLGEFIWLDP